MIIQSLLWLLSQLKIDHFGFNINQDVSVSQWSADMLRIRAKKGGISEPGMWKLSGVRPEGGKKCRKKMKKDVDFSDTGWYITYPTNAGKAAKPA